MYGCDLLFYKQTQKMNKIIEKISTIKLYSTVRHNTLLYLWERIKPKRENQTLNIESWVILLYKMSHSIVFQSSEPNTGIRDSFEWKLKQEKRTFKSKHKNRLVRLFHSIHHHYDFYSRLTDWVSGRKSLFEMLPRTKLVVKRVTLAACRAIRYCYFSVRIMNCSNSHDVG